MKLDFIYFALIYKWLTDQITTFGNNLVSRSMAWATSIALILVMLWILIQGFRILTGRSRDSMMAMVTDMSRIAVIVAAATTMAVGSVDLQQFFGINGGLSTEIKSLVTGSGGSLTDSIDNNLVWTQLAMGAIDGVQAPSYDVSAVAAQGRASLIAALGVAGPPMTAGAMLLMYQVAIALFIGFGPLFILCLIFEQTKPMFNRWLMYGLGTLFSLAVLDFMTSIVLDQTARVAEALWASNIINAITGQTAEGFTNQAMQQGGIGLLMTVLLVSTPPMAAAFFAGTLGGFVPYAQVSPGGGANRPGPQGQAPGTYPHQTSSTTQTPSGQTAGGGLGGNRAYDTVGSSSQADAIKVNIPPGMSSNTTQTSTNHLKLPWPQISCVAFFWWVCGCWEVPVRMRKEGAHQACTPSSLRPISLQVVHLFQALAINRHRNSRLSIGNVGGGQLRRMGLKSPS